MNQDVFVEEKKKNWEELDSLLKQVKTRGITSFRTNDIRLMGSLYRKVCSDLSYARSKSYNKELVRYLNQLARKAYGLIYLSDDSGRKWTILKFYLEDFPASFRKYYKFIMLAVFLFLFGLGIGFIWNHIDSGFASYVVPQQILQPWTQQAEKKDSSMEDQLENEFFPFLSSRYWTHNFSVGVYAFVLGIIFGLGPLYFMIYNGIIFGALASSMIQLNYQLPFFSFILSHSFIELMAIFICGGAGFMIAWGLISPGDMKRGDSLNKWGREAVKLVLGTIPMFLFAGIIESSISRFNINIVYKIIFASITVILMAVYFSYVPKSKGKNRSFKLNITEESR